MVASREARVTKKPVLKLPPFGEPMDRSFVAMDAEWAPDRSLLTLGFADTIRAIAVDKDLMARLNPAIVQIPLWLGGHNVPGDLDYLVALGLAKSEWVEGTKLLDSYILAKLVNENLGSKKVDGKGPYNLQRLLQRVFEVENWKAESESFDPKDATTWPPDVRVNRCARDAWASARLIQHLVPRVAPPFLRYAHRLMMTLHRVFLTGVCVDTGALDSLGAGWRAEVVRARELVERAAAQHRMRAFSVTKPADVRRLVYKKLKIPVTRRTAKGRLPAVDKITLGQHKANPVVKHLLDFRRADKLLGSWYGSDNPKSKAIPLVRLLEKPGPRRGTAWLRAVLNPFAARTGRRSSGGKNDRDEQFGKNMQNWPPVARTMIVSRYNGGEILSVDYSKLEVVLFAWRARDRKLFYTFYSGSGYIGIAEEMFGKKVEKDTPLYTVAKSTVLACQYGAEDFKFAEQLCSSWACGSRRTGRPTCARPARSGAGTCVCSRASSGICGSASTRWRAPAGWRSCPGTSGTCLGTTRSWARTRSGVGSIW